MNRSISKYILFIFFIVRHLTCTLSDDTCRYISTNSNDIATDQVQALYVRRTVSQCSGICTNQTTFTCYGFVYQSTLGVCYMYNSDLVWDRSNNSTEGTTVVTQQYKRVCESDSLMNQTNAHQQGSFLQPPLFNNNTTFNSNQSIVHDEENADEDIV